MGATVGATGCELQVAFYQLFAVWEEESTWHFLWRSDNNIQFSGNIYFDGSMGTIQKRHFSKKDVLNTNKDKDYAAEFNVSSNGRRVKTLDIIIGKKSEVTCYIKIDGQVKLDDIVIIRYGKNPKEVPFTLSSSKKN